MKVFLLVIIVAIACFALSSQSNDVFQTVNSTAAYASGPTEVATFAVAEYRLQLRFPANGFRQYKGEDFTIWRNGVLECIRSVRGRCTKDYTGTAQSVEWYITRTDGGAVSDALTLREYVTTLPTTPAKPNTWLPRGDFNLAVPVQVAPDKRSALASDFQSSGYSIPQAITEEQERCRCRLNREQMEQLRAQVARDFAGGESWFRQGVFLGEQQTPFATLVWHHTPTNIVLEQVYDRYGQPINRSIASLGGR